jgi:hypothetical protein
MHSFFPKITQRFSGVDSSTKYPTRGRTNAPSAGQPSARSPSPPCKSDAHRPFDFTTAAPHTKIRGPLAAACLPPLLSFGSAHEGNVQRQGQYFRQGRHGDLDQACQQFIDPTQNKPPLLMALDRRERRLLTLQINLRFVRNERVPGAKAVFEKFADYQPRQ